MKKIIYILFLILALVGCELTNEEVKPNIKLITVALSYKEGDANGLPHTQNDATCFTSQVKLLCEKAGYNLTTYSFVENDGKFYFNTNDAGKTFKDDLNTLFTKTLVSNSQTNDITIFYYSGHGSEKEGNLIIGNDQNNWITSSRIKTNTITPQELHDYITPLMGKKLIILDSCFSGNAVHNAENAIQQKEIFSKGFAKLFSQEKIDNKNTWYMTAASSEQESYEVPALKHGLFTYYLLEGLGFDTKNEIATNTSPLASDNMISLNELFHYIDTKIKKSGEQNTQKGMSTIDLVLFKWT